MHARVSSVLRESGFPYVLRYHSDAPEPILTPRDFAHALGYDPKRVTKSLLVSSSGTKTFAIGVCSASKKLVFPAIAGHLGSSRLNIASLAELREKLDYPVNGVSPLGVGEIPVFIDKRLFELKTILIGSGEVGVEIEIAPAALLEISHAIVGDFAV